MDITISGEDIKSIQEFHQVIKQRFSFPEYYGENLDALWDSIRYIELPCKLIWKDHRISQTYLATYFDKVHEVFHMAEREVEGFSVEYK